MRRSAAGLPPTRKADARTAVKLVGLAVGPHATGLTKQIADEYVRLSLRVPGSKCDGPGCNAEPSENAKLLKCQKCQRKYYCSKTCQVRASDLMNFHLLRRQEARAPPFFSYKSFQVEDWKTGRHKSSCRPPKDFKKNDIIRAQVETLTRLSFLLLFLTLCLGLISFWRIPHSIHTCTQGIQSQPELNGQLFSIVGPDKREGRFQVTVIGGEKAVSLSGDKISLVVPAEERADL